MGQNLILNPGFELINDCPTALKQLEYAKGWQRANAGTPELFHNCGLKSKTTEPYEGEGMAGAIFLSEFSGSIEYLQTRLTDSLKGGKNYCLSYYIRLSQNSLIAINKIGAYFSKERLMSPDWKRFRKYPQVVNKNVVDNVDDWIKVEGSFKAKGGERYITIGNFYEKHYLIEKMMSNGANDRTVYYYMDNVNLFEVSGGCNSILREREPIRLEQSWSHIIYFEKDAFELSELEAVKLDAFIKQLPKPLYHLIKIEGHTDKDATFEYNIQLSQNRANQVKERMANLGLSNTYTTWSGEEKPTNREMSKEEKAKNRRVTITVER
ncbi:MAG: OmpA family protein [Flavobacteriales bacterium]|nr:OmpA family protein [Flavobacteriales bacterium]